MDDLRSLKAQLETHDERLNRLEVDMWSGKDQQNPSVVIRLDRLEIAGAKVDKLFWAVIIALVGSIIDAVSHHMH